MYLGVRSVTLTIYHGRYLPGIGSVPSVAGVSEEKRHFYRCEHCEREYGFDETATEPFFCKCGRLIGIEKGGG